MVTRMAAQQDPSFFANQAAARQPAAIPPMYQQQVSSLVTFFWLSFFSGLSGLLDNVSTNAYC